MDTLRFAGTPALHAGPVLLNLEFVWRQYQDGAGGVKVYLSVTYIAD
jgi:hypothetical protein